MDFWDNEASYTTTNRGFTVLDRVLGLSGGDKTGSIDARFKWVDPKQKALIEETRKMVFYSDPALRTIDFDIVLRAIEKATFNDTKEGTFGMRLAAGLEAPTGNAPALPKRTGRMVNSNGLESEANCWGKRANWVQICSAKLREKSWESLSWTTLRIRGIPRIGTYAATAFSRPTSSAWARSSAIRN